MRMFSFLFFFFFVKKEARSDYCGLTLKIEKSNERVSYVMGREGAKVPRKKRNARVEKSIMHDDDEYMNDSMKLSNYNDSFAGEEKRGKKKHEHKCETDAKQETE